MICKQCGKKVRNVYGQIKGCHGCYQKWLGINNKTSVAMLRYKKILIKNRERNRKLVTEKKVLEYKIEILKSQNRILKEKLHGIGIINDCMYDGMIPTAPHGH